VHLTVKFFHALLIWRALICNLYIFCWVCVCMTVIELIIGQNVFTTNTVKTLHFAILV